MKSFFVNESWLTAIFGLVIIYMAAPRLAASVVNLPGDYVLRKLQYGQSVEMKDIDTIIQTRETSLALEDSGGAWDDLAIGLLQKGIMSDPATAKPVYENAARAQSVACGLRPANPYGWARLASLESMNEIGDIDRAVEALRMSYVTGPFEGRLSEYRLMLASMFWARLDQQTRQWVYEDARTISMRDPEVISRLAEKNPAAHTIAQTALGATPGL